MSENNVTPEQNSLMKKLSQNPEIASLIKQADDSSAALAAPKDGNKDTRQRQADEQELAPGNPLSIEQMEKINPRDEGEDPVAYLDRIFG